MAGATETITRGPGELFGRVLCRDEVANLLLTHTCYRPGLSLPRHAHAQPYFCLVLEGGYTEESGRTVLDCRPSRLLFHPAGEVHADRFHSRGGRCFNVEILPAWEGRLTELGTRLREPQTFGDGLPSLLMRRLYGEFQQRDSASPLAIEALAMELLVEAARAGTRGRHKAAEGAIDRAAEFLRAYFRQGSSLTRVASEVALHPVHLARQFRKRYGCTLGEYARRIRVEYVAERLSRDDETLADLAVDAGFCDQSHLCRAFRSVMGTTPGHYRKLLRQR